jgi:hypothetical protein
MIDHSPVSDGININNGSPKLTPLRSTTALIIHRSRRSSNSTVAVILRCAERRHAIHDRSDPTPVKGIHSKDNEVKLEDMDWELNLRKYFDVMDTWSGESEDTEMTGNGSQPNSRASSFTQAPWSRPIQRQNTNPPVSNDTRGRSQYGEFRRGEDLDTNQYFRQPRRRSSSASSVGWVPANQAAAKRLSGAYSRSSNELVLYNPTHSSSSTSIATVRPIRRASITGDFHWEYVGRSSTFNTLAPLTSRWPELKDAQVDIYTQTQGMSSGEARAYSLGRLAGLSPEITNEVRRVLSMKAPSQEQLPVMSQPTVRMVRQPSVNRNMESGRRSISLDAPVRRPLPLTRPLSTDRLSSGRPLPNKRLPAPSAIPLLENGPVVPRLTAKPKSATYQRPPPESVRPMRKIVPSVQKRGFLGTIADLRPMTAISERSSRSGFSRTSLDKPGSRSIMQGFKSRRTNLSQISILESSILETVPDKAEGRSSSGSDTLTSNKDFEIGPVPRTPQSQKTVTTSSTMNVQKPLPARPKRSYAPRVFAAIFKSRKDDKHLQVPITSSLLSLHSAGGLSQESLRRVSMDILKRKDSRVTMMSMGENMDVPFDIWLRALPYIEGRCSTPRA